MVDEPLPLARAQEADQDARRAEEDALKFRGGLSQALLEASWDIPALVSSLVERVAIPTATKSGGLSDFARALKTDIAFADDTIRIDISPNPDYSERPLSMEDQMREGAARLAAVARAQLKRAFTEMGIEARQNGHFVEISGSQLVAALTPVMAATEKEPAVQRFWEERSRVKGPHTARATARGAQSAGGDIGPLGSGC